MRSRYVRFSAEWWAWMTEPEPNTGCLLWLGCVCRAGYGRLSYIKGSPVLAHRAAYECAYGPIDGQRHVCHRCDTPSCVNPDHLFIGTQEDNMRDMFAKGRGRPYGSGTPRLALTRNVLSAPVAVRELALVDTHERVEIVDCIHPIRTTAIQASWRHVTGVPAWRQDHDGPSCDLSQKWTDNPERQLATGATVAECCAPALDRIATLQTARLRVSALYAALGGR